jgi:diketogulonate reductase-like aldo/keto reductase
MKMLARLGLGTVQFYQDYGVFNRGGRPDGREVAAILARAAAAGVGYIDTAPAYGDAEALVVHIELAAASSACTDSDIEIDQPIDTVYVDSSRWPVFVH